MNLDETDRAILFFLQAEDRMHLTHAEIAERIDVSSSTVSSRIQDLKDRNVLRDYRPQIDYEAADIPHHLLFVCTASLTDRKTICEETIEIPGVITVRELLTSTRNLHVEVVAMDSAEIESVAEELDALGLEIEHSEILREEHYQPFDQFGSVVESDATGE